MPFIHTPVIPHLHSCLVHLLLHHERLPDFQLRHVRQLSTLPVHPPVVSTPRMLSAQGGKHTDDVGAAVLGQCAWDNLLGRKGGGGGEGG